MSHQQTAQPDVAERRIASPLRPERKPLPPRQLGTHVFVHGTDMSTCRPSPLGI